MRVHIRKYHTAKPHALDECKEDEMKPDKQCEKKSLEGDVDDIKANCDDEENTPVDIPPEISHDALPIASTDADKNEINVVIGPDSAPAPDDLNLLADDLVAIGQSAVKTWNASKNAAKTQKRKTTSFNAPSSRPRGPLTVHSMTMLTPKEFSSSNCTGTAAQQNKVLMQSTWVDLRPKKAVKDLRASKALKAIKDKCSQGQS
jgi:hypothetical protein